MLVVVLMSDWSNSQLRMDIRLDRGHLPEKICSLLLKHFEDRSVGEFRLDSDASSKVVGRD